MYSSRDNWERLVTAVVRKQQIWELFHSHSISTIASSDDDDDDHSNEQFLDNRWAATTSTSVSPPPLNNPPSASQVIGNKYGEAITPKLFPASWYRAKETKQEYHIFNIPVQTIYELGFRSWMKSFFLHRVNNKGSKYPKGSRDSRKFIDVEYLKYFSHHIFLVADEINMALHKGYSLRIRNEWVTEARALKHHLVNYLINNDQYINDPMFNWEELTNVSKKIVDHMKNCPSEMG